MARAADRPGVYHNVMSSSQSSAQPSSKSTETDSAVSAHADPVVTPAEATAGPAGAEVEVAEDATPGALEAPAEPPELLTVEATAWEQLQQEKRELEDRWLRLQAEFDNFRKRTARERLHTRTGAVDDVTRAFLPVVDNVDRALAAATDQGMDEQHLAGWQLIHQQLYDVLRSFGVEPMAVVGQPFDPRYHDALTETPHDAIPAGQVAVEVERGYMAGDRVLRTAKVAVSRGPADESA